MAKLKQPPFLPASRVELDRLGIENPDIILVSGDAYVDHPSFASAILGRTLWNEGYTVAVMAQPDITVNDSFLSLGTPNLFFSVSAGTMDSMICHYTAAGKRRHTDAYSPGGRLLRPDRATLVYSDIIHRTFPEVPIITGGVEASLRRFAHYDYWSNKVRQSIIADAPANLLVYGNGEKQLLEIANRLSSGEKISTLTDISGTVYKTSIHNAHELVNSPDIAVIPSYQEVKNIRENPELFCKAWNIIKREQNFKSGRSILQMHPKTAIIQNRPVSPLRTSEIDEIYNLPYRRLAHPSYKEEIPALATVKFSVQSHRGCYGNCSFCSIALHQGRIIQSRSPESILLEIEKIARLKDFRGTISDVGGPSANMYGDNCKKWQESGACTDKECINCKSVKSGFNDYLNLLNAAKDIPGVKHVFIGSGIRYDKIPDDTDSIRKICGFVSGHLKIAPEHISENVLKLMNKPSHHIFEGFRMQFEKIWKNQNPRQYLVPYLISGHPGCTVADMIKLSEYLRDNDMYTEQVQDFTPSPMTESTCMYATGIDPKTMKKVHIPSLTEKKEQRAILHWKDPRNSVIITQALIREGRRDLIGYGPDALVKPGKETDNRTRKSNPRLFH